MGLLVFVSSRGPDTLFVKTSLLASGVNLPVLQLWQLEERGWDT